MTDLTVTRSDDEAGPVTLTIEFASALRTKRGAVVEQIVLKEPLARQVRDAEKEHTPETPFSGMLAYELMLIRLVAGINEDQVDALPVGATNIASEFLSEFVERGTMNPTSDDPKDMDDSVPTQEELTILVDPPIMWQSQPTTEIQLREPLASEIRKARQLMRSGANLFEYRRTQIALVTAVTGLPQPIVEGMRISLLNRAARVLARFMKAGRRTGSS